MSFQAVKWVVRCMLIVPVILIIACAGPDAFEPHPRDCEEDIASQLLAIESFPENWSRGDPIKADHYGAEDQCVVEFFVYSGLASQDIFEYKNERKAIQGYNRLMDIYYFSEDSLDEVDFLNLSSSYDLRADEANIGCLGLCQAMLRYDTRVVYFFTQMSPDFMTVDNFAEILRTIDKRMMDNANDIQ